MKKQIILASILIILAIIISLAGGVLATNKESLTQNTNNIITENTIQNNIYMPESVNSNQQNIISNEQISETIDDDRLQDINEELYNLASTPKKDNRRTIVAAIIAITTFIISGLIVLWYRTNGY